MKYSIDVVPTFAEQPFGGIERKAGYQELVRLHYPDICRRRHAQTLNHQSCA